MRKKVAIVTGGAKGIGRELVKELANNNYDVIISYNKSKIEAEELMNYINNNTNVNATIIKCDITNEQEIIKMRDTIIVKYNKIDLLINNASYACDNYIDDKSKEEFLKVLEVNVVGTFLVTKYLYPYINNGIIVNVSSTDATYSYNKISMDYCASKAAINSLTKTFSQEFTNIKVIGVMPRWTNTESVKEMNQDYLKNELKRIGQERLYEPDEVAKNIINIINSNINSGDIVEV